jgi:hypothetical protein
MEKESPTDKLLKTCGLPAKTEDREEGKYFEAMLNQAKSASAWAQQAQDESDKAYRKLNAYIRDQLPADLVEAYEKVAQNQVAGALRPLDQGVQQAACRIESCAESLARISWNARLMGLAVLVGIATVSMGALLVRCTLIDDKFDEERRYELYGRKVQATIERYKTKDREKLYKWVGGRP